MENKDEYVLYILMRTDVPSMNAGKAMAHAAHAANQLSEKIHASAEGDVAVAEGYDRWIDERGFGTTICLAATQQDIDRSFLEMNTKSFAADDCLVGHVIDPTYPFTVDADVVELLNKSKLTGDPVYSADGKRATCFRREHTCSWVFCKKVNTEGTHLSSLPLHK